MTTETKKLTPTLSPARYIYRETESGNYEPIEPPQHQTITGADGQPLTLFNAFATDITCETLNTLVVALQDDAFLSCLRTSVHTWDDWELAGYHPFPEQIMAMDDIIDLFTSAARAERSPTCFRNCLPHIPLRGDAMDTPRTADLPTRIQDELDICRLLLRPDYAEIVARSAFTPPEKSLLLVLAEVVRFPSTRAHTDGSPHQTDAW
jgi:hypothetical protein